MAKKEVFAYPSKHVSLSVLSGSALLKLAGMVTMAQNYGKLSLLRQPSKRRESFFPAGTRTMEKEITLTGNETFSYALLPSEVLIVELRSLVASEPCRITISADGTKKVYTTKENDLIGLIFSVWN